MRPSGTTARPSRASPTYRAAHFNLGRILVNQEKVWEALVHLRQTLTPEDDETPRCTYALAAALARVGIRDDALKYMVEAEQKARARGQLGASGRDRARTWRRLEQDGEPLTRALLASLTTLSTLALAAAPPPERSLPVFTDVAAEAGVRFTQVNGSPEKNYIFEAKGGGVAVLDYDGDGLLDIYFVNGSTLEDVREGVHHSNALYRADGDGTWSDVTEDAGVARAGLGDGLCRGRLRQRRPARHLRPGHQRQRPVPQRSRRRASRDATEEAGLEGGRWSTSAAFVDHDRDGDLDLYVANNIRVDIYRSPLSFPGPDCNYRGTQVMCGPRPLPGARDAFYRNNGDGTFTDVTQAAGVLEAEPYYGLGVAVGDYDNDGWPDIYVANDSTPSYLYRNLKDGTFEDVALLSGVAVSDDGMEQAGMGIDFGDYDNDGWLDAVKSNFAFEYHNLYHNERNGSFTDQATRAAGTGLATRPLVSWGTKFLDYDNDGWKDIVVINGQVYPHLIDNPVGGEHYHQPRLLFRNLGDGRFADVSAESGPGIREERSSRGLAVGDLDNDGDLDMVVVNIDSTPSILRNDGGNAEHWLSVRLRGTKSNRMGLGARLTARTGLAGADRGGHHRREHLLGQRLPGALRAGGRRRGGPGDPMAERHGPDPEGRLPANQIIEVDEDRGLVTPGE